MLNVLFSIVPVVNVRADINPNDINYSWDLSTFSAQVNKVWNGDNFLANDTGSYNDVFNYTRGYAISDDEWMEEESKFTYNVNYSYFSDITLFGDYALSVDLDVYKVSISYGTSVKFMWIGLKKGTLNIEYNVDDLNYDFSYENSFYKKAETTYNKYNSTTMELLDTWDEIIEDNGSWLSEDGPESEFTIHQTLDMEFSMPMILTFQVYETQNGEKVAWADMISDFYIFEDLDKNGVFSVGETSVAENRFQVSTSDETRGIFMPWAHNYTTYAEYWSPETSFTEHQNFKYPDDRELDEFSDSIQFTPPQLVGNEVEWNILYPDFPIYGYAQTEESSFFSGPAYEDSSPGNFSYGYNYEITNETAGLDLTAGLPRLCDDFLNEVENMSLAFPHYMYFLSSAEVKESKDLVVTVPSDVLKFEIGDTQVAEINMEDDKKYYSLMDYPDLGINKSFEAIGSTVSKLVTNALEINPTTPKNPFVDTIFTLGDLDLVRLDSQFDDAHSLYSIEMQNYPTWSGYELIHDPTLTIYHGQQNSDDDNDDDDPIVPDDDDDPDDPDDTPDDTPDNTPDDLGPTTIPGYDLCVIAGLLGVVTALIAKKKKLKKSKFQL